MLSALTMSNLAIQRSAPAGTGGMVPPGLEDAYALIRALPLFEGVPNEDLIAAMTQGGIAQIERRGETEPKSIVQLAQALGVSLADVNALFSSTWGVSYVNDFIDKGRTKRVYMQADAPFRMQPEDLNRWYVRNRQGEMVPFSAIASSRWTSGSPKLERFNGIPAVVIQGEPAPGHSSGEAMAAIESIVKDYKGGTVAAAGEGGITAPWQVGQCRPQPAPEPVARTKAPHATTATFTTRVDQANRRSALMAPSNHPPVPAANGRFVPTRNHPPRLGVAILRKMMPRTIATRIWMEIHKAGSLTKL